MTPSPERESASGVVQAPGSETPTSGDQNEPEDASESAATTEIVNRNTSSPELATNNSPPSSLDQQQVLHVRGPEVSDPHRVIGKNVFVAGVEEIFHQKLDMLKTQEEGCFSGRRPIRRKGRLVDSEAIAEVNCLIGAVWDTRESKNFWVLNLS